MPAAAMKVEQHRQLSFIERPWRHVHDGASLTFVMPEHNRVIART